MKQRTFQVDGQWTIMYYPDQPSGFCIMILGGEKHYVNQSTSFLQEHPGKYEITSHLLSKGYTLCSSNLLTPHWGSQAAADLTEEIYEFLIRKEILNEKFHIIAEGISALLLTQIAEMLKDKVRSIVMMNPYLSLQEKYTQEKDRLLFFKKFSAEVIQAHNIDSNQIEFSEWIKTINDVTVPAHIPLKIIHVLDKGEDKQVFQIEAFAKKHSHAKLQYVTPEKRYIIPYLISTFFKENEKKL